ncbi:hypothetical protein [Kitasatospora sp. NPDC059673]|uniref:hypothetical protein n=1 Tax=Kitasatospora sp. NPDC059673 TaxID=3346901 RepID=UPI0036AAF2BB
MALWHRSGRTAPGRSDPEWSRLITPPRFATEAAPEGTTTPESATPPESVHPRETR